MSSLPPVTPTRAASNLVVPILSPVSRRSSPRAEDFPRRPRKAEATRKRLEQYQTFDHAVQLLQNSNNIVVLTGAGISTSVGIPDFRSDQGLYSQLSKLGITQAEEFFSKQFFIEEPEKFFKYVKRVVPSGVPLPDGTYKNVDPAKSLKNAVSVVPEFTPTHAFLAMLQAKDKLLTNYTQNIDGLEQAAGVCSDRYVQCHGSWDTATCLTCHKSSSSKKYLPVVLSGNVPYCKCSLEPEPPKTKKRNRAKSRPGQKRKRANSFSDHSSDDNTGPLEPPRGLLKPDITFFEENITPLYHSRLESDRPKIDLLIIMGTSLKVDPVKKMLFEIHPGVPQIYISRERFNGALCSLPGVQVDIELLGECDVIIEELCRRAGWTLDLRKWCWQEKQVKIKGFGSRYAEFTTDGHLKVPDRSPLKRIKSEASIRSLSQRDTESEMSQEETVVSRKSGSTKSLGPKSTHVVDTVNTEIQKDNESKLFDLASKSRLSTPQPHPTAGKIQGSNQISSQLGQAVSSNASRRLLGATALATKSSFEILSKAKGSEEAQTQTSSKVKIELVEGTTHQWRITRKK